MSISLFPDLNNRVRPVRQLKALALAVMIAMTDAATAKDVLDELIEQSVKSYPSVKSKEMARKSAKSDVTTAQLSFLPNASVAYEPRRKVYGGSGSNKNTDPYTVITLTQPLLGGGLVAGYRQSQANLNVSDWAMREEAEAVAVRLINAYGTWLSANKKVQAGEESVKEHERFVGLITRRAEAGASPTTDQNLGVSRLLLARSELSSFKSAEATAFTTLNQLVGVRLTREQLLSQKLETESFELPTNVIVRSLVINPTLKRLEFTAESVRQASKVVRSQALPQVSLQAKRTIGDPTVQNVSPSNTVGLVVNYTSGAGLSSISKASAANSRYRAALLDIDSAKRDLVVRVNQDVSDYGFAKRRAQALLRNVDLTKTVSESYDRLFLVGKKSWLDLMNAVRERKDTQVSLAEVQSQVLVTSRRLRLYSQGLDFENFGLALPAKRSWFGTKVKSSASVKTMPLVAKADPSKVKVDPSKAEVDPSKFKVDPSKFKADPSKFKADPSKFKADPSKVKADPSKVKADPSKVKADPSKFKADPSKVKADPSKVKADPSKVKVVLKKTKD
jgi:adhesin transport system outer membrane protein